MNSNIRGREEASDAQDAVTTAALFRAHASAVFAVCLANTQNYHDAEDVMQNVFLKTTAKISSLHDPGQARAWLLTLARRECIDFHRRRKPADSLVSEPLAPPSVDDARSERLLGAVQKLPANYREAIVLYYLDGRDCSNVADSLGTTEQAVRQRLVRARAMLHNLLQEERP
jgi:RNA polymerase sigma-70 factor (ECF subfamily)